MVAERAANCCEYCRCPASHTSGDFSVEHIVPRSGGGTDDLENLAWSCQGCNNRKFTAMVSPDPITQISVRLFHPRRHAWAAHFQWSDDALTITGKTATGRATVERLKLNRLCIINLRRALIAVGEHPPSDQ